MQKVLQHLLEKTTLFCQQLVLSNDPNTQAKPKAGPYDIGRFDSVVRKVGCGHMLSSGGVFSIVQVVYLP